MSRRNQLVAVAVVLGFLVRVAFAVGYWVDKPLTIDQVEYLMLADNLAAGEGFVYDDDGQMRLMRSPGYPAFLAATFAIYHSLTFLKVVQSLVGALAVFLVAALTRRVGGDRAAVIAAFLTAFYPPLVFHPAYVLSEFLYTFIALAVGLAIWRNMDRADNSAPGWRRALPFFASGLFAGIAVLTRPELLFFLGLIFLVLLHRRLIGPALALTLGTMIVVAPWTLNNYLSRDAFVLVTSRSGPNFWMGNNPLAMGDGDVSDHPEMKAEYRRIIQENQDLTPEQLEAVFYDKAFGYIRQNPLEWAFLQVRKVFFLFVPFGPSYSSHSKLFWVAQATSYLLLVPFALVGFLRLRRRKPQPAVLWALAGATVLTCVVYFPLPRYRIPVFDPVMIVCAAVALASSSWLGAKLDRLWRGPGATTPA